MQVLRVLSSPLPLIKPQYPGIIEIPVESDDASFLSSLDITACIHYLNKKLGKERHRWARDDWTLPFLSSTQCFQSFNLMSKAEMKSGREAKI
jgi:hypothetical protein